MTRNISLLLVGLLATAVFAVEPSDTKRLPESEECANQGELENASQRPELHRLPSVLVSKTSAKRTPGVDALWQAAPAPSTSSVGAPPVRIAAPEAEAGGNARLPVTTSNAAKPTLAPLPVETPVVIANEAPAPLASKSAPAAAPVEAPARLAPITAEPAVEKPIYVAAAPAMIRPAAMPMPMEPAAPRAAYSDCAAGSTYEYCPTCDACNQIDTCHGREGWFAHIHRKHQQSRGCLETFCEPPLGASVYAAANAQINKGLADQTILYQYDFYTGERAFELNPRGRHQLAKIAELMLNTGLSPLVIESTPTNPRLDEARRAVVLNELKALEPSFADASVVVARPRTVGLRGDEATIIDDNNLMNTQRRGGLLSPTEGFGSDDQQQSQQ